MPASLDAIESDLDLHDGSAESIPSNFGDSTGAITPGLLAKHHLPDILLHNGPLAIRHIMGYLTTSVPGFSSIPPAKARRLVVGALEGRGSVGEGGGLNGDVKFEKVGWGRWDARMKGQAPPREFHGQLSPPLDPRSSPVGMPINNPMARSRLDAPISSWAGDSNFSPDDEDEDIMMLENEADKMSLDGGDESCSSSEAPPEDEPMGDDPGDATDEEDWATVGAASLRQASYPASGSGPGRSFFSHVYTAGSSRGGGGASFSTMAKSVPVAYPLHEQQRQPFSTFGMTSDSQEREAIEALLRLGSV